MKILFSKEDHQYSEGDKIYTSVSAKLSKYKNEFDRDHWSTYKAIERIMDKDRFTQLKKGWNVSSQNFILHALKYVDDLTEVSKARNEILEEWRSKNKKSIVKGNVYHDSKEKRAYKKGHETNPFDGKKYTVNFSESDSVDTSKKSGKTNLVTNLFDLPDGYYPELLIWNEDALLAGQADKVFIGTDKGKASTRFIDVDDFKTVKKIKKRSFMGKKMKAPLDHLMDCNYYHYSMQISMYAWMLEQFGFRVRNLSFHHFNKQYTVSYLKNEVESIV